MAPNWFRPKLFVPSLVGHLPRSVMSILSFSCEGKMMRVTMEWEVHQGQCNKFPGIYLTTEENPRKFQLGNCWRHLVAGPVLDISISMSSAHSPTFPSLQNLMRMEHFEICTFKLI